MSLEFQFGYLDDVKYRLLKLFDRFWEDIYDHCEEKFRKNLNEIESIIKTRFIQEVDNKLSEVLLKFQDTPLSVKSSDERNDIVNSKSTFDPNNEEDMNFVYEMLTEELFYLADVPLKILTGRISEINTFATSFIMEQNQRSQWLEIQLKIKNQEIEKLKKVKSEIGKKKRGRPKKFENINDLIKAIRSIPNYSSYNQSALSFRLGFKSEGGFRFVLNKFRKSFDEVIKMCDSDF